MNMKDEYKYTELTKADTLNRLTYLVQLHKDRANDESLSGYMKEKAQQPVEITVITHGELDTVVLSMTKAKELINKTWLRMLPEAERLVRDRDFVSAIPTMELHLTEYGTLWMHASIDKTAGPELRAKWDAIEATRKEQFPEHYTTEEE
jgi:hypothetical protein